MASPAAPPGLVFVFENSSASHEESGTYGFVEPFRVPDEFIEAVKAVGVDVVRESID